MLPAIISPEFSRQLSMKGQNQKKALGSTNVFDVLAGGSVSAPPPPRRLKLPTVGASTLRRLANRAKVVAVEDVLAPKEFSGIGTAAGPSTPQLAPAEYLRGVGVIAAYRAYFFPELAVQWAMYMVWLQGRAAGLPTAAIKQLDGHGRTLLAQYPGEYHTPADLTESVQALMPAPPSRPRRAATNRDVRLILDLSQPEGLSVNCFIDREAFTLQYVSIDQAIQALYELERFRALQPTARPTPTRAPAAIREFLANPTEDCRAATGYAI
ncbi:hypothetical protein FJT64_024704 [Amphibalanus amphitrite]|uniref:Uncharacterized protein n=1 Tax=Amphibalanus amphitrite TaxID=1232801 RepID=A0A6A4WKY4_AMPAM|nr:hypothetical protein FJT64_024704 [Amphibalanus amphitrite]